MMKYTGIGSVKYTCGDPVMASLSLFFGVYTYSEDGEYLISANLGEVS